MALEESFAIISFISSALKPNLAKASSAPRVSARDNFINISLSAVPATSLAIPTSSSVAARATIESSLKLITLAVPPIREIISMRFFPSLAPLSAR